MQPILFYYHRQLDFKKTIYLSFLFAEIDIADVCEPKSSVIRTMELLKKYQTGPKKLIGILSMTTSANMLNVSWFLSSLPSQKSVIQIGTAETADKLNNRALYRTFFRVIPDDGYQFQLIAQLLKKLNWNYVAILYEKDVYGEEGAKLLTYNVYNNMLNDDTGRFKFQEVGYYNGKDLILNNSPRQLSDSPHYNSSFSWVHLFFYAFLILRCRLFLSFRSRIRQALDCSPTDRERELGLDRRETG
ncbi:unnamed protein product [Acanthosepion pharaonis]|uniref:Receptor ligand binding region domain-containing protein n=1 Tax=Acanthosepion pharaonis TaxID=158019 RepID=A0A812DUX6_ACAPH|nr:unnamed protein product [Sepia pharaonis]